VSETSGTQRRTDEPDLSGVAEFARGLAALWDQHLGERLSGIYLIGSLAHGGYSAQYSDIDVALITLNGLITSDLELVHNEAARRWPDLASGLSLFWTDETFSSGRFPPLDRIDYLDHRRPLLERRRATPARPSLFEIREYLSGDALLVWSRRVIELVALDELATHDHKRYLRTLLYPARFLYSWETGNVASNDDAVAYVERRNLVGPAIDLVVRALHCRNDGSSPASLFPERQTLRHLLSICKERVGATRQALDAKS
jgi:hypothetical protein